MFGIASLQNRTASSFNEAGQEMDDHSFYWWTKKLEERTGIIIPATRKQFLATNLNQRIRATHSVDESDYYTKVLCGDGSAKEWAILIDRLTVHQTHFFRHEPSFNLVEESARKSMQNQADNNQVPEYHIWSVGCSTGEETYSLSMVLASVAEAFPKTYYSVVGTDVSQPALAQAKKGNYDTIRLREVPEKFKKYCQQEPDEVGFSVTSAIKKRVAYAALNLLDTEAVPILNGLNMIFCQNVLIYLPRVERFSVLDRFASLLKPGGILLLGPGEVMSWNHEQMQVVDYPRTLAFQRCGE